MNPLRALPILALLVILPWTSHAFVVATDREGRPLHWSDPSMLRFVVHLPDHVSASLPPNDEVLTAIEGAAASWSGIEGSAVTLSVETAPRGTPVPPPGFDRDDPEGNENSIIFETEEWRHEPGAFAVTLRTYGGRTGNLLHADIVVNGVDYRWEALEARSEQDPDGAGPVDVQAVITHEIGHALGFEHTQIYPSTMRSTVGFGEIWMRELSETDFAGLRSLYPASGAPVARDPDDLEAISAEDVALGAGCGPSDVQSRPLLLLPMALLPMGMTAFSRRRRRVPSC